MPLFNQNIIAEALRRLHPVGAVALAALLILRGLSLGIPYVSPDLSGDHATHSSESCH